MRRQNRSFDDMLAAQRFLVCLNPRKRSLGYEWDEGRLSSIQTGAGVMISAEA
jgi:hypothetical protein